MKTFQEIIIAEDFNGRIGKNNNGTVEQSEKNVTKDNGKQLIQLCQTTDHKMANGIYRHKDRCFVV